MGPEHVEDEHLEELDSDGFGECGDRTVSHYQTANCTLPDEVLSGLRGLDGAILLLQMARHDLLRQVGLSEAVDVTSAKGESENIVGKCYQPGCLQRAAHKCRGCLQVQYCSKQCQEIAWGQHLKEECVQVVFLQHQAEIYHQYPISMMATCSF